MNVNKSKNNRLFTFAQAVIAQCCVMQRVHSPEVLREIRVKPEERLALKKLPEHL